MSTTNNTSATSPFIASRRATPAVSSGSSQTGSRSVPVNATAITTPSVSGTAPVSELTVSDNAGGQIPSVTMLRFLAGSISTSNPNEADYTLPNLAGDVTGAYNVTVVGAIQGVAWSSTAPTDAQVAVYNSTSKQWVPVSVSGDATWSNAGVLTLAAVGTATTKGTASRSATVTTDTKGRVTSLTDQLIGIDASQVVSGAFSGTVALAKLTSTGTNGSLTVTNGLITAYTAPT